MKLIEIDECVRKTTIKGKTTAIVASCQSPMNVFMWSIFSLLLRSSDKLEHIIACLNGPDSRTGPPELQNKKQMFLEELRSMKWNGRDMPLTIIRVWSRIGHAESLEMAIPWVHTEMYTLMHDDVIIRQSDWLEKAAIALADPEVILVHAPPLLSTGLSYTPYSNGFKINLPHLNSMFVTCCKDRMYKLGQRWTGFHVEKQVSPDDKWDEFVQYHRDGNCLNVVPPKDKNYGWLSLDIGCYVFYACLENKLKFVSLEKESVFHFGSMSWRDKSTNSAIADDLVQEILASPFAELYKKYAVP